MAQHIGIDLDDGALSWDEVTALPLVDHHAAIVHMTASSTPAHPRMRVLFLLDEPCDDPDTYTFIVGCFLRAFATADPHCSDPSRLFFGAPGCALLATTYKRCDIRRPGQHRHRLAPARRARRPAPAAVYRI
jgi:hypothetical protein